MVTILSFNYTMEQEQVSEEGTGLERLPLEVLTSILLWCSDPCDFVMLGSTCSTLRSLVRDDHLWRSLFDRLYSPIYSKPSPANQWPPHFLANEGRCWPEFATKVFQEHNPLIDWAAWTPPKVCWKNERAPPVPFGHMKEMGKNWRWLCIAHATRWIFRMKGRMFINVGPLSNGKRSSRDPDSEWKNEEGSAKNNVNDEELATTTQVTYIGDVAQGKRNGYGVQLAFNKDGKVTAWMAGVWQNDSITGWRVLSEMSKFQAGATVDNRWSGLRFVHSLKREDRLWGITLVDKQERLEPVPRVRCDDRNCIRLIYNYSDESHSTINEHMVGPIFEAVFPIIAQLGRRQGNVDIRFHNGDIARQKWENGDLVGIDEFICSPSCPDARFAGRKLGAGLRWVRSWFPMRDEWHDTAYWPTGNSEDVALFWEYVDRGFIGWSAEARDHFLKHAPQPPPSPARCVS